MPGTCSLGEFHYISFHVMPNLHLPAIITIANCLGWPEQSFIFIPCCSCLHTASGVDKTSLRVLVYGPFVHPT